MPKPKKPRKRAAPKKKPDATVLSGILATCSVNVSQQSEGGCVARLLSGNGTVLAEATGMEPLLAVCNLAEVVGNTWGVRP